MKRVLFVCIGNACRSIMAEALARHYWAGTVEVASAGLDPLGSIPEMTTEVLREMGVSAEGLRSKGIHEVGVERFHVVVNLATLSLEDVLPSSFRGKLLSWHVRDPYRDSLDSFRQARDAIDWLITEKLPGWIQ
jgi:protein-tyrosine-phosphatase